MAVFLKKRARPKAEIPIAPMIDCVFLLLMYFMVSATFERQEADISFQLPGVAEQTAPIEMPDEQILEILADGRVRLNDYEYEISGSGEHLELAATLLRFRQASEANRVEAAVTLQPDPQAVHQAIVRVLDACSVAGIEIVHFGISE